MRMVTVLAAAVLAGGCAWVKLEPQGSVIRVARTGEDLSSCQRAGEITVSVRDRVGFYERDALKVRDELETMARNEAGSLQADTLQALGPPVDGEQRFVGYRCGTRVGAVAPAAAPVATPAAAPRIEDRSESPAVAEPLPAGPVQGSQGFEPIEEDDGG